MQRLLRSGDIDLLQQTHDMTNRRIGPAFTFHPCDIGKCDQASKIFSLHNRRSVDSLWDEVCIDQLLQRNVRRNCHWSWIHYLVDRDTLQHILKGNLSPGGLCCIQQKPTDEDRPEAVEDIARKEPDDA